MALQRLEGPKECTSVLHYIQKDVFTVWKKKNKKKTWMYINKHKEKISFLFCFYTNVLCFTYIQRCQCALAPCSTFIHLWGELSHCTTGYNLKKNKEIWFWLYCCCNLLFLHEYARQIQSCKPVLSVGAPWDSFQLFSLLPFAKSALNLFLPTEHWGEDFASQADCFTWRP